ncbi:PepSY-associated TM helix domain-containing protein [Mitsuaria sp. GD03876]|uniref:PepSY-associated TM helix domain-containing protein n=1 Tax=Mitsuaria sp. GD03876 TaxID=2975399 RepID=UPI002447317B|nr:PepSY-associated TM helix domain-containing protein [Mitsuaria sp. GD03876]MDH0867102.1 PepSY domain-containing protein [Mitsuaria sp. GD03876]
MALMTARRAWMWLHRWTGLTLGMLLAAAALLGTLMTVLRPLDEAMHPELFRALPRVAAQQSGATDIAPAPEASSTPFETVRRRMATEFGAKSTMTIRPPREDGESMRVLVRGPGWEGTLYLDPVTLAELGRRGEAEGLANTVFELHSALLLGDTGKAVLAFTALAYLALLVTGLILWWPMNAAQWRHAFKLKLDKGTTRGLFDLHRFGGAVLGLLVAVAVASGAWMAYRPIGGWVNTLVGDAAPKPPKVGKDHGERVPLDVIVAEGRARWPDGQLGYVQLGASDTRPVRLRFRLPGEPHPNGLSSIWAHPVDGHVLGQQRWDQLDLAGRSTAWIYPLHAGELFGIANRVITGLVGLVLFGMGVTGAWLWWRRRR